MRKFNYLIVLILFFFSTSASYAIDDINNSDSGNSLLPFSTPSQNIEKSIPTRNIDLSAIPEVTIDETNVFTNLQIDLPLLVAYHPDYDLYYLNSLTHNPAIFDPEGNLKADGSSSLTWADGYAHRGHWYNPNLNAIGGQFYNSKGYYTTTVDANGIITNEIVTSTNNSTNMPSSQHSGCYDAEDNMVVFFNTNKFMRYSMSGDYQSEQDISITIPSGSSVCVYSMAYTGISGQEYALYDKTNRRALLYNKTTGTLSTIVNFNTTFSVGDYGFSYANGHFFLTNHGTANTLYMFKYLTGIQGPSESVIGDTVSLTFDNVGDTSFIAWYKKHSDSTTWTLYNDLSDSIGETYSEVGSWDYKLNYKKDGDTLMTTVHTVVAKYAQTISFDPLLEMAMTDDDQAPVASVNSDSTITFSSSNTSIATIVDGKIHPVGVGTCTIYADAAENERYWAAEQQSQGVVIKAQSQTITFNALSSAYVGDADLDPGAYASSELPVSYSSSDSSIATIVENKIRYVSAGTCTIYANQAGDPTYAAAPQVAQELTVMVYKPSISNITPSNGSILYKDTNYTASATITTEDANGIDSAIIVFGTSTETLLDTLTLTANESQYSTDFEIDSAGTYYAKFVAYGANGEVTSSDTVELNCISIAPVITKTYPSNDTIFYVGDSLFIGVKATVPAGSLDGAFFLASFDGVNAFADELLDSIAPGFWGLSGYTDGVMEFYLKFGVIGNGDTTYSDYHLWSNECPDYDGVTALEASAITTTSFTAHWTAYNVNQSKSAALDQDEMSDYYLLNVWKVVDNDTTYIKEDFLVYDTSYVVSELAENTEYQYNVRYVSLEGCTSNYSNTINAKTSVITKLNTLKENINIISSPTTISITSNTVITANIYHISGQHVDQATFEGKQLFHVNKGLYLVEIDGKTQKVIVP